MLRSASLRVSLRRKEVASFSLPSTYETTCTQSLRTCCLDVLGYFHLPLWGWGFASSNFCSSINFVGWNTSKLALLETIPVVTRCA